MKNISTENTTKSSEAVFRIPLSSAEGSDKIAQFEQLYLDQNYKDAAQYLLDNKGLFESGIFHYNLGTIYLKLEDYPTARFHLEKAFGEGRINSSTLNNLIYVKEHLSVDDLDTSTAIPDKVMSVALGLPQATYLAATLFLILVFLLVVRMKGAVKKLTLAIMLLLALIPVGIYQFYVEDLNKAIAFKDIAIYEGPSKIFSEKGQIKAGSKIILGEQREGWFYVKFPISLTGWINKDELGIY